MTGVTSKAKKVSRPTKISSLRSKPSQAGTLSKRIKKKSKVFIKGILLSPKFYTTSKLFIGLCIGIATFYGSFVWVNKTFANEIVISKSEIISRAGKLTPLPKEDPIEIVRVQDAEDLRKQNEFYSKVEEGDYILMYKNLAVIYNLRNNQIIGIKQLPVENAQ